MYVFKDRSVLECLYRTISAYAKIGEFIRVEATPSSLQFSVANSSSTVIGRVVVPAGLFTGPGASRTLLLKARAFDFVLKRIEVEDVGAMRMRFRVTHTGQEQLEVNFVEPSGVSKQFRINCLETVVLPLDFVDVSDRPCTFACLPAVLKDAFASCEASADEARMQFTPQHVSILAKRRGAAATGGSVLTMGLKTIIKLQPGAFRQLSVLTPWQAEFKLKEFRVMLAFLWQLSEETPICAAFDVLGPTTPIVFTGSYPACPELSFVFKFMARVSTGRSTEANTWLRVGLQPSWASDAPLNDAVRIGRGLNDLRRDRVTRVRRITTALTASTPSSTLHSQELSGAELQLPPMRELSPFDAEVYSGVSEQQLPQPTTSAQPTSVASYDLRPQTHQSTENTRDDEETRELGFTQAEPTARGLFD